MKALYISFAVITLSLCSYAQATKVIEVPLVAAYRGNVSGEDGKLIASDSKGLEIVEIRVEGKTVVPGQPFAAGNDWLGTLAVKVKNVSDKKISSIRLSFGLPEAKYRDGFNGFSLEYGKELSTGIDYGVQGPIEPGQEVVLQRNERHYARDKEGIAKRSGISEFNLVRMGGGQVKFADGTSWFSYKLPVTSAPIAHN
jgi:hypothetical protein